MMPDTSTLLAVGAKDPVGLAQGQIWRLFTPIFIHIGLLHFAVNSYTLYIIGWQIERILGSWWFLGLYLVAGVCGNVTSALFSVSLSAGASGALFGLLGVGFCLEYLIGRRVEEVTGRRPRNRAYAMTVLINLGIGFMVPFIDNSAHLGGLMAGLISTYAMLNFRPNSLHRPRPILGKLMMVGLLGFIVCGGALGSSPRFVLARLQHAASIADGSEERLFYLSQAITIDPDNAELRLERARILLLFGEGKYGIFDLRRIVSNLEMKPKIQALVKELNEKGRVTEAWQVQMLLEHGAPEEL
jgi:rhomboid protease GluP